MFIFQHFLKEKHYYQLVTYIFFLLWLPIHIYIPGSDPLVSIYFFQIYIYIQYTKFTHKQ